MGAKFHRWLLALPLLTLAAGLGRAGDAEIKVTVVAILATDRNTDVDAKVKCVADEVQKLDNYKYLTGFRQYSIASHGVAVGKARSFTLVDNQQVAVTILEVADQPGKVRLTVRPPTLGNITYSTACGKCLPIVTSYKTKDNELLIIAVMVKPCAK